jgi:hypothetical protein
MTETSKGIKRANSESDIVEADMPHLLKITLELPTEQ